MEKPSESQETPAVESQEHKEPASALDAITQARKQRAEEDPEATQEKRKELGKLGNLSMNLSERIERMKTTRIKAVDDEDARHQMKERRQRLEDLNQQLSDVNRRYKELEREISQ